MSSFFIDFKVIKITNFIYSFETAKCMSVVNLARKIIPQGRFRRGVKEAYNFGKMVNNAYRNGCDVGYCLGEEITTFRFNQGALEGTTIRFPKKSFHMLSSIPIEVQGYFALGRLAEDSIVIDGGAYPGDFTVAAARMVPRGKVFAFEPNPKNREYLKDMLYLNGLQGIVEVLPYALSDHDGTAKMILAGMGSEICSPDFDDRSEPKKEIVDVITRSLDSLLMDECRFPQKNDLFIKMDIEGHEIKACAGARNTMKHGAIFAIAAYHPVDGQKTAVPLAEMFEDRGYEARQEYPPHLTLFAQPKMR